MSLSNPASARLFRACPRRHLHSFVDAVLPTSLAWSSAARWGRHLHSFVDAALQQLASAIFTNLRQSVVSGARCWDFWVHDCRAVVEVGQVRPGIAPRDHRQHLVVPRARLLPRSGVSGNVEHDMQIRVRRKVQKSYSRTETRSDSIRVWASPTSYSLCMLMRGNPTCRLSCTDALFLESLAHDISSPRYWRSGCPA